jgi:hypothetical protein
MSVICGTSQLDDTNNTKVTPLNNHSTGKYKPINPDKYKGDLTKITFRSSWELHMNKFLDTNPNVLEWSSEPFGIPYVKPTTGKIHKYYPDYWIKYIDKNGNEHQEIIEIKPEAQTKQPTNRGRKSKKTILHEQIAWAVNQAKWKAAAEMCQSAGIKFKILTERSMFK